MSEGSEGVPVRLVVDLVVAPGWAWSDAETAPGTFGAIVSDCLRRHRQQGHLLSVEVTPEEMTRRGDFLESLPSRPTGPTAGQVLEEARRGVPEGAPNGRYMHLPPEEALDVPARRHWAPRTVGEARMPGDRSAHLDAAVEGVEAMNVRRYLADYSERINNPRMGSEAYAVLQALLPLANAVTCLANIVLGGEA